MSTPATMDEGKAAWHTYVTTRTKAMPKNSLFGTSLENADFEAAKAIDSDKFTTEELARRREKKNQYEHKLPARLQNNKAKEDIAKWEKNLTVEEHSLSDRQRAMLEMEDRAKYFQQLNPALNQSNITKKKMLLAEPGLDFETTQKMNGVGFLPKNSYNRDKYQKKAPVHQYSVIGDPLRSGMDFALNQTETHEQYQKHKPIDEEVMERHIRKRQGQRASAPMMKVDEGNIPANIRAIYGSAVVDKLFADETQVNRAKSAIRREHELKFRRHKSEPLPPVEVKEPKNYADLGNALRMDKFGGEYTYHQPSLMKDSHTYEVFARRYKDPDEFRHQWDEYGKWAALKLQWDLQKKALDALKPEKAN